MSGNGQREKGPAGRGGRGRNETGETVDEGARIERERTTQASIVGVGQRPFRQGRHDIRGCRDYMYSVS